MPITIFPVILEHRNKQTKNAWDQKQISPGGLMGDTIILFFYSGKSLKWSVMYQYVGIVMDKWIRAMFTTHVSRDTHCLLRRQVDGSSMALLGNTEDDDMRHIAELTISRLQMTCPPAPPAQITSCQSKSVDTPLLLLRRLFSLCTVQLTLLSRRALFLFYTHRKSGFWFHQAAATRIQEDRGSPSTYLICCQKCQRCTKFLRPTWSPLYSASHCMLARYMLP